MQNPSSTCPRCQSPIPTDAPGGLCPSCALLAVAEPTNPSQAGAANAPTIDEVAAAFPDLEVLELIGQGGMGVVFKARQPRLDRLVALKILPPALAAQPGFAERFTREARVLARLAHPHIVAIYDFGENAGFFYLIMEFVNGVNLRAAIRAGVKPEQALALVPRICEALQFAHDHGVLHRDIKPENILLDTAGTPKLADFGIAKLAGQETTKTGLTVTGAALGTVAYMSPEQIEKPSTVDHRADIYSLGVVLYEMLTGELPLGRFAAPSEKSSVNRGVDEVVMRSLEKERERRQQSATEMRTQVEHAATNPAARSRAAVANPWPNRLFWLVVSLLVLPLVATFTALLIPRLTMLGNDLGTPAGGGLVALVALLPFFAGAVLYLGYRRTRPRADQAAPHSTWNPWPKRVFILFVALIIVPALLFALGLALPTARRSARQATAVTAANQARLAELTGAFAAFPTPTDAAAHDGDEAIRAARARLKSVGERAAAGVSTPFEKAAAERDLAVAEARHDQVKIAEAFVSFAEQRLTLLKAQVEAGSAPLIELHEAGQQLDAARRQLEKTRRSASADRAPDSALPGTGQPAQP